MIFLYIWGIWAVLICIKLHLTIKYYSADKFNKELPEEYKPFQRMERHKWNMWEIYLGGIFILPFRLVLLYSTFLFVGIFAQIVSFKLKLDDQWPRWRWLLFKPLIQHGTRVLLLSLGYWHIDVKSAEYSTYDTTYKQSNSDRNTDGSILISNHVSMFDTFFMVWLKCPSFLSKKEVEKDFITYSFAKMFKSIFVDRNSEAGRQEALHKIEQRSELIKQGQLLPPVQIFPEGTVTNGNYLLTFKKGAFQQGRGVKMVGIKYNAGRYHVFDNIGFMGMVMGLCQLSNRVTLYEFVGQYNPEAKDWEELAEKSRQVLAKCLDAKVSNSGFRESSKYYDTVFCK